jgi:hypothetical protein
LTYNLVQEHSSESASNYIAGRELHAILADWNQQRAEAATTDTSDRDRAAKNSVKKAVYLLEHKYTQSNLSIESLKNDDRLRARELLSICDDYGITLYLASLERGHSQDFSEDEDGEEEENQDDEDDEDENSCRYSRHSSDGYDESITLSRLVDAEGHEILKDIPIEEKDIVQIYPFEREPIKSECEDYTGNEGASTTQCYKDTVCTLWLNSLTTANGSSGYRAFPNDSFADVMMHRPSGSSKVVPARRMSMMLEYLVKRVQHAPELKSQELRKSVHRACELIATHNHQVVGYPYRCEDPIYTNDIILDAFKVCMTLGMREPLKDLATSFQNEIPDYAVQSLRNLIPEVGFEEINSIVSSHSDSFAIKWE